LAPAPPETNHLIRFLYLSANASSRQHWIPMKNTLFLASLLLLVSRLSALSLSIPHPEEEASAPQPDGLLPEGDAPSTTSTTPSVGDVRRGLQPEGVAGRSALPIHHNHHHAHNRTIRPLHKGRGHKDEGFRARAFFESALFFDWCLFCVCLLIFFALYHTLIDLPSTDRKWHGRAVFVWFGLGGVYALLVTARLGEEAGIMWVNGYLLEVIFSLENVFVFHIIVEAFHAPRRCVQKALFVLVCCQVLYEMLLIMGLAEWLDKRQVLPYLLGLWLLYLGVGAAMQDDHDDLDIMETRVVRIFRHGLGSRLVARYERTGWGLFVSEDDGTFKVTLLFLLLCCLILADFLLEVDVALTKIEELPTEYISFTSSAIAGFAMPELFFVGRDLFKRYTTLKYGISFILVFYGVQMLLIPYFEMAPLEGCGVIIVVMACCMLFGRVSDDDEDTGSPGSPLKKSDPLFGKANGAAAGALYTR